MLTLMIPLLVCFLFTSLSAAAADDIFNISKGAVISKPGCPSKCGSLTVPYPFGIGIGVGSGCALHSGFEINCTERALIGNIQIF